MGRLNQPTAQTPRVTTKYPASKNGYAMTPLGSNFMNTKITPKTPSGS